jgi:hypothetical protein
LHPFNKINGGNKHIQTSTRLPEGGSGWGGLPPTFVFFFPVLAIFRRHHLFGLISITGLILKKYSIIVSRWLDYRRVSSIGNASRLFDGARRASG